MKTLISLLILLICIPSVGAVIEYNDNETVAYLIDNVDQEIFVRPDIFFKEYKNINYVKTINSTCLKGWTKIHVSEFDFTYEFIYDKDGDYGSSIVNIKQIQTVDTLFNNEYERTLTIDGIIVSNYTEKVGLIRTLYNPVYFSFNNIDNKIFFGNDEITMRLFFTELNMQKQYNYFNFTTNKRDNVKWHFYTESEDATFKNLGGLTGILYNVLGRIPWVGESIQNIIFLPLFLIQTLINFSITFLKLIINNWWYALMLLEIMCILPILKYKKYPDLVRGYIKNHVDIILFVKDKIMIPLIQLIIQIIVVIRNMFRI